MANQTPKAPRSQSVLGLLGDKVAVTGARFQGGDSQQLQIAVIKATNHDEVVPKEKHVRTLKVGVNSNSSRSQVVMVIQGLSERLKSGEWLIVLKTLMVYHRLFREADVTFLEEFCTLEKGRDLLVLDNFTDVKGGREVFDYSAFVRSFSLYLNQRKELYNQIRYDSDRDNSDNSMILGFPPPQMLEAVPLLHKLLQRIVNCVPEGKAARNPVVQSAVLPLVRECLRVYRTAQEGLVKLIDVFFEMDGGDAMKCVQSYREALELHERMLDYFQKIQTIPDLGSSVHMPNLQPLPSDFLQQMEEYAQAAREFKKPVSEQVPVATRKMPIRSKTMQNVQPVSASTSVLSGGYRDGNKNMVDKTNARDAAMQNVQQMSIDLMKLNMSSMEEQVNKVNGVGEESATPSPELDPFGEDFIAISRSNPSNLQPQTDPFDPFGDNSTDPFSSVQTKVQDNPFSHLQDNTTSLPTNNNQEDPFLTLVQSTPTSPQPQDPFFNPMTNYQQQQNGDLTQPQTQSVDPFQSDPFGNSFEFVQTTNAQDNIGDVTMNPFTQKPVSAPIMGSKTMRRSKDPLELLNEELGLIAKDAPKPQVAMNQMRQSKQ